MPPSFIQDYTDFLNKLLDLNYKPTTSTLLVSFDVVNMFPNIDNNLGIKSVRKALNSRETKSPNKLYPGSNKNVSGTE